MRGESVWAPAIAIGIDRHDRKSRRHDSDLEGFQESHQRAAGNGKIGREKVREQTRGVAEIIEIAPRSAEDAERAHDRDEKKQERDVEDAELLMPFQIDRRNLEARAGGRRGRLNLRRRHALPGCAISPG